MSQQVLYQIVCVLGGGGLVVVGRLFVASRFSDAMLMRLKRTYDERKVLISRMIVRCI